MTGLAVVGLVAPVVAFSTSAEAAGRTCVQKVIQYGNTGSCVKNIQTILNASGLGSGSDSGKVTVDGFFGNGTDTRVRQLQTKFGITRDGVVGPGTWNALCYYERGWSGTGEMSAAQRASGCPTL